jgi:hypothetical protein
VNGPWRAFGYWFVSSLLLDEWSLAQRRVRGEIGISFVGSGKLTEPWAGHAAGASYLVLRVDCSLERQRAQEMLADIAGISDLMWERGWTGRRLRDGSVVTDLKIFPGQRPSPVGSPS